MVMLRLCPLLGRWGGPPPTKESAAEPSPQVPVSETIVDPIASTREPFRWLLPATLFLLTFVSVMTMLLIYMDNTAMRRQQFRQNMRQEEELAKVSQDDDVLVAYIRQWQLASAAQPFPPHTRHPSPPSAPPPSNPSLTENYVAQLLNYKHNGVFVEIGAYGAGSGGESRTEWLEGTMGWTGLLVTPDAHDYFHLRGRRKASGTFAIHACLSSSTHPKEITYQENGSHEDVGVIGISALGSTGEEFSARVKCFPLFSLLLAAQEHNVDFLSLSCGGCELAAIASLPRNKKIHISLIEVVGEQTVELENLLTSRGYNIAKKTPISVIYAFHDIPTLKI